MSQFVDECLNTVLNHSGAFIHFGMTDAARTWAVSYLSEEVELGGVPASREAHCANPETREDFFKRLALVGNHAMQLGLARQALEGRTGESELRLTLEDLEPAERIVARASASGLCEPG